MILGRFAWNKTEACLAVDGVLGKYWVALAHVPMLGSVAQHHLLQHYEGDITAIFSATRSELAAFGLKKPSIAYLVAPPWQEIATAIAWAEEPDQHLICFADAGYPELLKHIQDPPLLLYCIGDAEVLCSIQIAIVGSRNPSPAGKRIARAWAGQFADCGLSVTSGLALGIDGESHHGSLEAGGRTLAVLGNGVDVTYPRTNAGIRQRIVEQGGALISEFPLFTPPLPRHFPRRNRLISGLSLGVLVVEATLRSGSLITARCAVEQNREVFAVPGSIHNSLTKGCHALIKQGAHLVESVSDILEILRLEQKTTTLTRKSQGEESQITWNAFTRNERQILAEMGDELVSVDLLVGRTQLSPEVVLSLLVELEMKDCLSLQAGGLYQKKEAISA